MRPESIERVAIVGAGMAGLNLARRLVAGGLEVTLFEKARGPSGRLSTRRAEDAQFDHGAQYLTARDDGFRAQVADWVERGVLAPWDGRLVRLGSGRDAGTREDVAGAPRAPQRFVGRPRMSAIARDLLGAQPIEVGIRIASAARDGDRWRLRSESGTEYPDFDALLLAVPPAQALPFLERLPDLHRRVAAVRMWPCHAVMARFAMPLEVGFEGAFVEGPTLSWAALDSSKPDRDSGHCWVLHSRAEWSAAHVELDSDAVIETMLDEFARVIDRPLPAPTFASAHRWLYARTDEPLGRDAIWDEAQRIGLCGDWLRGDRVEDAYLSGERLAADVLRVRSRS